VDFRIPHHVGRHDRDLPKYGLEAASQQDGGWSDSIHSARLLVVRMNGDRNSRYYKFPIGKSQVLVWFFVKKSYGNQVEKGP
jgi:hypothetical protein